MAFLLVYTINEFLISIAHIFGMFKWSSSFLDTLALCLTKLSVVAGGGCKRIGYPSSIPAFLDLGKAAKSHLPAQSPINSAGGTTNSESLYLSHSHSESFLVFVMMVFPCFGK